MISLEISDVFVQNGETDIEISCLVKCSSPTIIIGIQLMRSNKSILYLWYNELHWQDLDLRNRSEATANATCIDGDLSYLRVEIPSSMIKPSNDTGSYMCRLRGLTSYGGLFQEDSEKVMLKVIGNLIYVLFTRKDCSLVNANKYRIFSLPCITNGLESKILGDGVSVIGRLLTNTKATFYFTSTVR